MYIRIFLPICLTLPIDKVSKSMLTGTTRKALPPNHLADYHLAVITNRSSSALLLSDLLISRSISSTLSTPRRSNSPFCLSPELLSVQSFLPLSRDQKCRRNSEMRYLAPEQIHPMSAITSHPVSKYHQGSYSGETPHDHYKADFNR